MQWQTKTADKAKARLVLWTLAEAPRALTLEEVTTQVVVTDRSAVREALDDLTNEGMLVHRDGRWAVSEDAPGASVWAESFGPFAFSELSSCEGSDAPDLSPLMPKQTTQRWTTRSGKSPEIGRLSTTHHRKQIERMKAAIAEETVGAYTWPTRPSLVLADVIDLTQQIERHDGGLVSRLMLHLRLRHAESRLRRLHARRAVSTTKVTRSLKQFFDLVGPPPGWAPGTDESESDRGR